MHDFEGELGVRVSFQKCSLFWIIWQKIMLFLFNYHKWWDKRKAYLRFSDPQGGGFSARAVNQAFYHCYRDRALIQKDYVPGSACLAEGANSVTYKVDSILYGKMHIKIENLHFIALFGKITLCENKATRKTYCQRLPTDIFDHELSYCSLRTRYYYQQLQTGHCSVRWKKEE